MSEREDDFLGRWSRRKAEARGGLSKKPDVEQAKPVRVPGRMITDPLPPEIPADQTDADADGADVHTAALREDLGDTQAPVEMDEAAPRDGGDIEAETAEPEDFENFDFDSLDYDSDYTRFMKGDVPEAVRKRALRLLWGSNPILANVDGLNDYDEDFTDGALAVKGLLKTAYKPGSGYLTEEDLNASYSEEARKAGVKPEDEDDEVQVAAESEGEESADESAGASDGETETATQDDAGSDQRDEPESRAAADETDADSEEANAAAAAENAPDQDRA